MARRPARPTPLSRKDRTLAKWVKEYGFTKSGAQWSWGRGYRTTDDLLTMASWSRNACLTAKTQQEVHTATHPFWNADEMRAAAAAAARAEAARAREERKRLREATRQPSPEQKALGVAMRKLIAQLQAKYPAPPSPTIRIPATTTKAKSTKKSKKGRAVSDATTEAPTAAPTEGGARATPKAEATTGLVTLQEFPLDDAFKLVTMVRKAQKAGEIGATFSVRKLMMWAQSFALLQVEGYPYHEALAGSFHLAVEGKTYGEDRTFLRNVYQQVFIHECRAPKPRSSSGNRHPMDPQIEPLIREGVPIWLYGPTGAGKSHTVHSVSGRLGRPYYRIQGTGDMTVDDLLGGWGARDGSTYFEHGPLPLAMKHGGVLNIDEITACPPEVLFELQAVLEGKPLVIKKNRGEEVRATPGFAIVACDNTLGLGERSEYIGTNVMNEAFRDRFLFAEFDYMPPNQEKRAVAEFMSDFASTRNWTFAPQDPATVPKPRRVTVNTDLIDALTG